MTIRTRRIVGAAAATALLTSALSVASCQQAATNVTTRSLQLPQKMDIVCLQVNRLDGSGVAIPTPLPGPANECTAVSAANTNPAALPRHLYAVVTQNRRGELGVVDLTAGVVVDVDRSTPGVGFVPVGANPTDVAVTADGAFTFVSSADPNKPALYGVDNTRLLGDSTGSLSPLRLPDVLSCRLRAPPQALAILAPGAAPDGGGTSGAYVIAVVLRSDADSPAELETISFDANSVGPGSLAPCVVLGRSPLSSAAPTSPAPAGPSWPDGVPYADAGQLFEPSPGPTCSPPPPDGGAPPPDDAAMDDAAVEAGPTPDAGGTDAAPAVVLPEAPRPTAIALRSDMPILYVADGALAVIHVIDLRDPTSPRELDPLLATSTIPAAPVSLGGIAISPPTRDYKTYLYAIDHGSLIVFDVTDPASSPHVPLLRPHDELTPLTPPDRITFSAPVAAVAFASHDWPLPSPQAQQPPVVQYTGLLCNPNPNALPKTGMFVDRGAYYRADQTTLIQAMDTQGGTVQTLPTRLRGVFAFATLSNGAVVVIDVDDWDAPCRRPDPMGAGPIADPSNPAVSYAGGLTGALDLPEPSPGPGDLDPYHAPITYSSAVQTAAVTLEPFFPVSAPHRLRSASLLRNDPVSGVRIPHLQTSPQLFNGTGAAVAASGASGSNPLMLPTPLSPTFIDPSYVQNATEPNPNLRVPSSPVGMDGDAGLVAVFPGSGAVSTPSVRVSFDDPTAHLDQDWTVTYEGALPTLGGVAADLVSSDHTYRMLTLSSPGARFCAAGVEDWNIGRARASQVLDALRKTNLPAPPVFDPGVMPEPTLGDWTSDYVEIMDDLLVSTDPYWSQPSDPDVNDCWDDSRAQTDSTKAAQAAQSRFDFCQNTFGTAATADTQLLRDLPIVDARDDALTVTRFAWFPTDPKTMNMVSEQTTNRIVNGPDPSNQKWLRAVRCCFHHQARFRVRAGGEWLAVGTAVGLLHHVTTGAGGQCVLSCDPRLALMNARAFDIPWATLPVGATSCTPASPLPFDRNSPLALRNPMFSLVMWSGCGPRPSFGDHTLTNRDLAWKFQMRGSFTPLSASLVAQGSSNAVSPQSMRFVAPFGQMAVVDGEAQGVVLIDLNLVAVAHAYF